MLNQVMQGSLLAINNGDKYITDDSFIDIWLPFFIFSFLTLLIFIILRKVIINKTKISKTKYFLFLIYIFLSFLIPIILMYGAQMGSFKFDFYNYFRIVYYPDPIIVIILIYLFIKYEINKKVEIKK